MPVIIYKKSSGYCEHLVELSDKINYNTILKEEYELLGSVMS